MSKESSSSKFLSNIYENQNQFRKNGNSSKIHQNRTETSRFEFGMEQESTEIEKFQVLPELNLIQQRRQVMQPNEWSAEFNPQQVINPQEMAYHQEMRHLQQMTHQMARQHMQHTRPFQPQFPHQPQDLDNIPQELWHQQFEQLKLTTNIQNDFDNQMSETVDWQSQFEEMWAKSKLDRPLPTFDTDQDYQPYQDSYSFEVLNPFLKDTNPFAQALEMKRNHGDLQTITLLLESFLQTNPTPEAWYELGLVHAENENEAKGIQALEECLKLDKTFKQAMIALSVAMVNENRIEDAMVILAEWLGVENVDLEKEFVKRISNDGDMQVALGLVCYGKCEYEKTISCFETALASRPGDYMLWSRLGATMSNSGNSMGFI
jgi:peroxin-5